MAKSYAVIPEFKKEVNCAYRFEDIGFNEYKNRIANIPYNYCVIDENAEGCIVHWVSPESGHIVARADYVNGEAARYRKISRNDEYVRWVKDE